MTVDKYGSDYSKGELPSDLIGLRLPSIVVSLAYYNRNCWISVGRFALRQGEKKYCIDINEKSFYIRIDEWGFSKGMHYEFGYVVHHKDGRDYTFDRDITITGETGREKSFYVRPRGDFHQENAENPGHGFWRGLWGDMFLGEDNSYIDFKEVKIESEKEEFIAEIDVRVSWGSFIRPPHNHPPH